VQYHHLANCTATTSGFVQRFITVRPSVRRCWRVWKIRQLVGENRIPQRNRIKNRLAVVKKYQDTYKHQLYQASEVIQNNETEILLPYSEFKIIALVPFHVQLQSLHFVTTHMIQLYSVRSDIFQYDIAIHLHFIIWHVYSRVKYFYFLFNTIMLCRLIQEFCHIIFCQ